MNDTQSNNDSNYKKMHEDTELLLKLIDSYVKVDLIKNCGFTGFVHSIDPVTRSIILSIPLEHAYETVILPGHAILEVTQENVPQNIKPPTRRKTEANSPESILKRKIKLMSWFKKHLLPVSDLNDNIVIGNTSILPPYNILDLCTDSPIVALQIKQIMECMPDDYEPK